MLEQSLFIIKPDAMQRQIYGDIISRVTKEFEMIYMQSMRLTDAQIREHYAHLSHLEYFDEIVDFMISETVIVMVLGGEKAISGIRKMVGATFDAAPGTIRGDYGAESYRTLVHASDSQASAEEEIERFFGKEFAKRLAKGKEIYDS